MLPLYDAALTFDPVALEADLTLTGGDLTPERDLSTSILLSLFTDRRAPASLELGSERDRRGWWGDAYAETAGDQFGSLLWTLAREKSIAVVAERAKRYAEESLAWMREDGIADRVDVTVELLPVTPSDTVRPVLAIGVSVVKPPDRVISYRFRYVWELN